MARPDLIKQENVESLYLYAHPVCNLHIADSGHIESAERLSCLLSSFERNKALRILQQKAREATREEILRAHAKEMVDAVFERVPHEGLQELDADTTLSPESGRAACYAAGACVEAVDAVMEGPATVAFCAIRPPGHHATRAKSGGFCLFNNVAIATLAAFERQDVERIAILDFDVHHGNGTQDIFWNDPRVMFASVHQSPCFPGTGKAEEKGAYGNVINLPLPPRTEGGIWLSGINEKLLPELGRFKPDLLVVSAGFDGHKEDPIADFLLTDEDYGALGLLLRDFINTTCQGRIVVVLEGGYHVEALSRSANAFFVSLTTKESTP